MSRSLKFNKWLETGYDLFALEGPEGIQIEKMARILELNKSGFYHYFGDMENFSRQLINYHSTFSDLFLDEVVDCQNVNPDYLNVLLKHKITLMVQMQLVKNKSNPLYCGAHKELDEKILVTSNRIWAHYINIENNPDLVNQYHSFVRDMLYSRVNLENFNFEYLHSLTEEAKEIVNKIYCRKDRPN